jgi:hypothetical protein
MPSAREAKEAKAARKWGGSGWLLLEDWKYDNNNYTNHMCLSRMMRVCFNVAMKPLPQMNLMRTNID